MISKRRKTATLRKNQRKRSNRGRRLHRMKMRGGVFPNDNILLTQFKNSETRKHLIIPENRAHQITPEILNARIEALKKLKKQFDSLLLNTEGMKDPYTHDNFTNHVLKNMEQSIIFSKYHNPFSYREPEYMYTDPGFILPILNEYLAAGFTPEELLRAELDDITITAILNEIVPMITYSDNIIINRGQIRPMKEKILKYGYDVAFLQSIGIPQSVVKEDELWTEEHNTLLKQKIRNTILTDLIAAKISTPARLIKLGFSKTELKSKGIECQLSELKSLPIKRLLEEEFTLEDIKAAGFTAKDFRNNGYNLKQLIEFGFKRDDIMKDQIKFSDDDFPANGVATLRAYEFKTAGFTFLDVYNLRTNVYTQDRNVDANSLKYLKLIGFTAQEFKFKGNSIDVFKLIVAGFSYLEITTGVTPQIENNDIYKALHSHIELYDKFSYTDLKSIGFSPKELSSIQSMKKTYCGSENVDCLLIFKNVGYTAADFQMIPTDDVTWLQLGIGRYKPLVYTSKYHLFHLKKAGFTLYELFILTDKDKEINKAVMSNQNLGPEYMLGYYDLKQLITEYTDDLINPDKFNIANIFKTGLYTYGEIRKVVDAYEKKGELYKDVRYYVDKLANYDKNLKSIKNQLTELKNKTFEIGGKGENVPMCERTGGLGGVFGFHGTTDDSCRYRDPIVAAPADDN
jgi:hypothetical protein